MITATNQRLNKITNFNTSSHTSSSDLCNESIKEIRNLKSNIVDIKYNNKQQFDHLIYELCQSLQMFQLYTSIDIVTSNKTTKIQYLLNTTLNRIINTIYMLNNICYNHHDSDNNYDINDNIFNIFHMLNIMSTQSIDSLNKIIDLHTQNNKYFNSSDHQLKLNTDSIINQTVYIKSINELIKSYTAYINKMQDNNTNITQDSNKFLIQLAMYQSYLVTCNRNFQSNYLNIVSTGHCVGLSAMASQLQTIKFHELHELFENDKLKLSDDFEKIINDIYHDLWW